MLAESEPPPGAGGGAPHDACRGATHPDVSFLELPPTSCASIMHSAQRNSVEHRRHGFDLAEERLHGFGTRRTRRGA